MSGNYPDRPICHEREENKTPSFYQCTRKTNGSAENKSKAELYLIGSTAPTVEINIDTGSNTGGEKENHEVLIARE